MPFAEDQHPVGDLGSGGKDEPLGVCVRARAPGRDLDRRDAGAGQGRVEGCGELPGPVADQEPEARGAVAGVHQDVADLLGGPRPVRMGGDPEDMHVAGAGFDDEQAVQSLERYRAVHGGRNRRRAWSRLGCAGTAARWCRVCRLGAGGILSVRRTRRVVEALTRWPSLRSSPWMRWYPQPWFSVATRSISA